METELQALTVRQNYSMERSEGGRRSLEGAETAEANIFILGD